MAFDPIQEDCLRLTLEAMRREHIYPLEDAAFAEQCAEEYRRDPASLIVHDRDRSFHLVALATEAIDYRIPFIGDDAEAERLTSQAEHQLQEALDLEPGNWDAQRMLAALGATSNDEYVTYLVDHRAEVELGHRGARRRRARPLQPRVCHRARPAPLPALARRARLARAHRRQVPPGAPGRRGLPRRRARRPGRRAPHRHARPRQARDPARGARPLAPRPRHGVPAAHPLPPPASHDREDA